MIDFYRRVYIQNHNQRLKPWHLRDLLTKMKSTIGVERIEENISRDNLLKITKLKRKLSPTILALLSCCFNVHFKAGHHNLQQVQPRMLQLKNQDLY